MGSKNETSNQIKGLQQDISVLKDQLIRQKNITQTLWQVIKDKCSISESELNDLFTKIESANRPGSKTAMICPICSRPIQDNTTMCIYCGNVSEKPKIF